MEPVIIASGEISRKKTCTHGQCNVRPVVMADREGDLSQFGVGVLYEADGRALGCFWGLLMPRLLIRSWRAMKLIEKIPAIDTETLCAASYAVGSEEVADGDLHYLLSLGKLFPTYEAFEEVRAEVLALLPTDSELTNLYRIVGAYSLDIDFDEVANAYARGTQTAAAVLERIRAADAPRLKRLHSGLPVQKQKSIFARILS